MDAAEGGNRLQSCRDVHAVAVDAVILHDHIAKVHADPGLGPLGRRPVGIGDRLCILNRLRTTYRVDHTVELAEHGITRVVDDAPLMRFDEAPGGRGIRGSVQWFVPRFAPSCGCNRRRRP